MVSLSGHIVVREECGDGTLLREIADLLDERLGIAHSTIQIEPENFQGPDSAYCD
jgi:Co/Zn/Cd efflux system component